jgi:hypothetical protein
MRKLAASAFLWIWQQRTVAVIEQYGFSEQRFHTSMAYGKGLSSYRHRG